MHVTWNDFLRGVLTGGLPTLVAILLAGRYRRRRAEENAKISAVLRRRDD
jgi:hypothetical protein